MIDNLNIKLIKIKALKELDQLYSNNHIDVLMAKRLKLLVKETYSKIKAIIRIVENEVSLQNNIENLTALQNRLTTGLKKYQYYPEGFDTKADSIRKEFLQTQNRLLKIEYCIDTLKYTESALQQEKMALLKESRNFETQEQFNAKQETLQKEVHILTIKFQKLSMDAFRLKSNLREADEQIENQSAILNEYQNALRELQIEYEAQKTKPLQYMLKSNKLESYTNELKHTLEQLQIESADLNVKYEHLVNRISAIKHDQAKISFELAKKQNDVLANQLKLENFKRTFEEQLAFEANLREESFKMDMHLKYLVEEKKELTKLTYRQRNELGALLKRIRQCSHSMKIACDSVNLLEKNKSIKHEELRLQKRMRIKPNIVLRKQLNLEIGNISKTIAKADESYANDQQIIYTLVSDQENLLNEIITVRKELTDLKYQTTICEKESLCKQKYCKFANAKLVQIKSERKLQENDLCENKINLNLLQNKLIKLENVYAIVKGDCKQCQHLLKMSYQRKMDLEQKDCLYKTEIEILNSGLSKKTEQLTELMNKRKKAVMERVTVLDETSKQVNADIQLQSKKKDITISLEQLRQTLSKTVAQQLTTKKSIIVAVCSRDDKKNKLDKQNNQICLRQDKLKLLQTKSKKVDQNEAIQTEKNKKLILELKSLNREINVYQKRSICQTEIENRLVQIQSETNLVHDRVCQITNAAINPEYIFINSKSYRNLNSNFKYESNNNKEKKRVRLLEGKEITPKKLQIKMDAIIMRLHKKEAALKEKMMIIESIPTISSRDQMQSGLELATQMNEYQSRNEQLTKRLKTSIAENRIRRLMLLKIKHELKETKMELLNFSKFVYTGCSNIDVDSKTFEKIKKPNDLDILFTLNENKSTGIRFASYSIDKEQIICVK